MVANRYGSLMERAWQSPIRWLPRMSRRRSAGRMVRPAPTCVNPGISYGTQESHTVGERAYARRAAVAGVSIEGSRFVCASSRYQYAESFQARSSVPMSTRTMPNSRS